MNQLSAAAEDAKALAKTLEDVAGFPHDHITLLTSDGETKPIGSNILFALTQLTKQVKAGDTVFVLFSGHGIELDGATYLLPYDVDVRATTTLRKSAVATAEVIEELNKLPAKALIIAYDMCRTDPLKGSRDAVSPSNTLSRSSAKNLGIKVAEDGSGPRIAVTFFACSPHQRSWEWASKRRGFFSYYLEKGLRSDAADKEGIVRIKNLKDYLQRAVPGAVQREQGEDQMPYPETKGPEADDFILAQGRPPGQGGASAVSVAAAMGDNLQDRYEATFQRAYELLLLKRIDAAQEKFEDALRLKPDASRAHYMLAYLNDYFKHDYAAAEKSYREAIRLDPKDSKSLSELGGLMAVIRHDMPEAERLARLAVDANPNDGRALVGLGEIYETKGEYAEAEKLFRRAMLLKSPATKREVDSKNALPATKLAWLLINVRQDYDAAEKLFREAIAADPEDGTPIAGLAYFYANARKDRGKAEELYRQAIQKDPTNDQALQGLGELLYFKKEYTGAEQMYRQAIKQNPYNVTAISSLGVLYELVKKDLVEAERLYRQALEADPRFTYPLAALGSLYERKKDIAEAEKWYRKALEIDPGFISALNGLANLFVAQNQFEKAETLYLKALEKSPKDAQLTANLGEVYERKKEYPKSELWFKKAMELDPKLVHPVERLTVQYTTLKQYPAAEMLLKKWIELDPANPTPLNALGNLYILMDDFKRAEQAYQQASRAKPGEGVYIANAGYALLLQNRREEARVYAKQAQDAGYTAKHVLYEMLARLSREPEEGTLPASDAKYPLYMEAMRQGRTLQNQGKFAEARSYFEKAFAQDATSGAAAFGLANTYYYLKDWQNAINWYGKTMKLAPKSPVPLVRLGNILLTLNQKLPETEIFLREAVRLDPKYADALFNLGIVRFRLNDYAQAETLMKQAIDIEPSEGLYHAEHAFVLLRLMRRDEAMAEAKKALALGYSKPHSVYKELGIMP